MICKVLARQARRLPLVLMGALTLSACMNATSTVDTAGIGFRQARLAEVTAVREWRDCRDEAVALDTKARESGSAARYLASARMLESCEAELGPNAAKGVAEERMRAYALSVQNHLKGGDVNRARENLSQMKRAFPGKDLRYPGGASFIASMELLLGMRDRTDVSAFALVNATDAAKSELRRARYWKYN